MYIDIGANSGSEKLWTEKQNTATSGKLIKALYVSYGQVYIFCTSWSGLLEYNWLFVGLGGGGGGGGQWAKKGSAKRGVLRGGGWMCRVLCSLELGCKSGMVTDDLETFRLDKLETEVVG
jgi:hypothetical protein